MGSYTPGGDDGVAIKLKIPASREFLGGDLLAQSLATLGVTHAFRIHGGHLDAFLVGCSDAGITLVDTRHEQVAVNAAESYAKVSSKTGLCFVTANSGFSNSLPALASAFADRSPVFCITSSPPLRDAETNALQGFHDQVVLAKPITKFAVRVTNVEEIPRIVAHAWRVALSGAPGPVLVDFPIDVLFSPPIHSRISWGSINRPLPYAPAADPRAIEEALQLWSKAERPAIITGTGGRGHDFAENLLQLAELTNTPIFYSPKLSPPIPNGHKLRGAPATRLAVLLGLQKPQPDLIVLLGARPGFLLGGRTGAILPNQGCKFIQVDVDGGDIGKSHHIDCGIVSSSANFVETMLQAAKGSKFASSDAWVDLAGSLKDVKSDCEDQPAQAEDGRMHPYHAMKTLFESMPEGQIITIDGGEAGGWALQNLEKARASLTLLSTGYLGFLGNGWGYALGAAVADPSRTVFNMQGDGSAGFHLAELDTFARHNLNIVTVISNNSVWGMSQAGQELIYGEATPVRPASQLNPNAEYHTVASGLQCASARVDKVEDLKAAVQKLSAGGPGLLNMIISDKPVHADTKAMLSTNVSKDWIVVPYYDNIPRPYYKVE